MSVLDYFKRILIVLISVVAIVAVSTTVMSFLNVPPESFNPYMYFIIAVGILAVFLAPKPLSIID